MEMEWKDVTGYANRNPIIQCRVKVGTFMDWNEISQEVFKKQAVWLGDASNVKVQREAQNLLQGCFAMWGSGSVVGPYQISWKREGGFFVVSLQRYPDRD